MDGRGAKRVRQKRDLVGAVPPLAFDRNICFSQIGRRNWQLDEVGQNQHEPLKETMENRAQGGGPSANGFAKEKGFLRVARAMA